VKTIRVNGSQRRGISIGPAFHMRPTLLSATATLERPFFDSAGFAEPPESGATYSVFAAARTSSACPGTLTLRQTFAIRPARSMRKVERSTPKYFLPYMLFSVHTP
jgi:hypothetical protein